jgi:hypothetical protein
MNYIELAMQAGFVEYELDDGTTEAFDKRYAKFAALVEAEVRADEREECAKLGEPQEKHDDPLTAWKIAKAIRARGTT